MSYIRANTEERTGYQTGSFPSDSVDNACDFVMVYRLDSSLPERIKAYKEKGYVIHFMTGISWGHYLDYLEGEYDGSEHWDEAQTDRFGNMILHSPKVPYMVPSIGFTDYLTEKLKQVVDAGVEAIHVEEPEFWDRAGYSEGFKREYELYYREKWTPPHESVDAHYKTAKLKQYLFTRTIDRLSASLKEYAKKKYNRYLRFYVPTHSLVNYTQWKIVSPEAKLADIPGVDGCIAQVWTGTSREKNTYCGVTKERTFETAFLEYGIMQELVRGTGRKMWFLHDPIEDNPAFDWTDYRKNYLCTVSASLLHPGINSYEICPWPHRVFEEKYPRNAPGAEPIPDSYRTVLNNMFNTLGSIENAPETGSLKVGVLTGDSQLYQREYPDALYGKEAEEITGTVLADSQKEMESWTRELLETGCAKSPALYRYAASSGFPGFYSLALPLLKHGVKVRPVLADNITRYPGYIDDYDVILASYEYMKPDSPALNLALASFANAGGALIYAGNGSDAFNSVKSWWTGKYGTPADHLFGVLGVQKTQGLHKTGKGCVYAINEHPCIFSLSEENAARLRNIFSECAEFTGKKAEFSNTLRTDRGCYITAAVMDESISSSPAVFSGLFADMFSPSFEITEKKTVLPGEQTMLFDFSKAPEEDLYIIGTSVRVLSLDRTESGVRLKVRGAGGFAANMRIRVPFIPSAAKTDGENCGLEYDEKSKTCLVSFASVTGERIVEIIK